MQAAKRTATFTESVIREMTRIANLHEAAQGFPDFPMPEPMKEAACTAINADINQYAVTWGSATLRNAIAEKYRRWYQMEVDPNREVTVTCGATEAMAAVFMALIDPGDEVIVLEPFYENYGPDAILAGAKPVFVPLERPNWSLDLDRLAKAFTKKTKAIVLNTPHNPTGRVLRAPRSRRSRISASSTTSGRSPTRRTSTWCTPVITTRSRRGPACASAPLPSRACRRRFPAPAGGWAMRSRRKRRRTRSGRCMTS
jgi:histidinol-phosphate/aromatic aminotransferase/cobyric acid decarboxylase-like protein